MCRLIVVTAQAWEGGHSFRQIPFRLNVTQAPRRAGLFAGRVGGAGRPASELRWGSGKGRAERGTGKHREAGKSALRAAEGTVHRLSVAGSTKYRTVIDERISLNSTVGSPSSNGLNRRIPASPDTRRLIISYSRLIRSLWKFIDDDHRDFMKPSAKEPGRNQFRGP